MGRAGGEKAREFGEPQWLTTLLVLAAVAGAGAGDARGAVTLLTELEQVRNVRHTPEYMPSLPDILRVAIAAGEPGLAARFAAGLAPVHPLDQHALVTARAQLAEYREEHYEAATLYADAERRWKKFEMPWERCWDTAAACSHSAARRRPEIPSTRRERSSPASAPPLPSLKPTSAWPGRPR